ncbi:MAG: hypothetical protein OXG58_04645 [Gemmatimonadetes bacterium]|nr:hypothetical protein [Gemmatimonadota bacterium]MCY3943895.1 hypothetical protein [Gemmatimonadota bacterium]
MSEAVQRGCSAARMPWEVVHGLLNRHPCRMLRQWLDDLRYALARVVA